MNSDTDSVVPAIQDDSLRRIKPEQRLRLALEMSEFARELALAGLRQRRPHRSDSPLRRALLRYAFLPDPLPPGVA